MKSIRIVVTQVKLAVVGALLPLAAFIGLLFPSATRSDEPGDRVRFDALGDPLPRHALLRLGTRRFQHPSGVAELALTNQDKRVISIDQRHLVGWDAASGKQLWRKSMRFAGGIYVGAAGYGIQPMAVLPEGNKFLTGQGEAGEIAVWDPETGESERIQVDVPVHAKSIDVSPDGRWLALGDADRLVVCTREGKVVYQKENHPDRPLNERIAGDRDRLKFSGDFSYGKFSPEGKLLALVNSEHPETIQLFEAKSGKAVRQIQGEARIVRMDFSPDGKQIAATERDVAARLYEVKSGKRLWEMVIPSAENAESYTSAVAFRPDGKQIAIGAPIGPDNRIRLLDAKTGRETGSLSGSGWKPWTVRYTRDGRSLFGSGWDGTVRRWDLETSQQLPAPGGVRATAVCAMSRTGKRLAFVDDSQVIRIVELTSGKTVKTFTEPQAGWTQIVFSHNGRQLAAGGVSGDDVILTIFEIETGGKLHQWKWPKGKDPHSKVEALAFSQNGRRIAAGVFRQSAAYVWDLPMDRQIAAVKHGNVYGLDLNTDGSELITAGWDKHIRVWDCATGQQTKARLVEGKRGQDDTRMYGVKLSNGGSLIATVDMTQSVRLFDRDLSPVSVISDAGWFTYGALQFARNDLWIGVGAGDGAKVFDVATGTKLWSVHEHEKYIYTVDFGAGGATFLSGGTDGVCYLWELRNQADATAKLDTAYQQLIELDSPAWFQSYQQLLHAPEQAAKLVSQELQRIDSRNVADRDVRRSMIALGSDNPQIATQARSKLMNWGLAIHDRLEESLTDGQLPKAKRELLEGLTQDIERRFRRALQLLAELDSPAAAAALDRLAESSRIPKLKRMAATAKKHRASLAGR